jgi:hypothetical protein
VTGVPVQMSSAELAYRAIRPICCSGVKCRPPTSRSAAANPTASRPGGSGGGSWRRRPRWNTITAGKPDEPADDHLRPTMGTLPGSARADRSSQHGCAERQDGGEGFGPSPRNHEGEAAVEESGEARVPLGLFRCMISMAPPHAVRRSLDTRVAPEAEREGEGKGAGIHPAPDGGQVKEERQGRWPQQRRVAERGEFSSIRRRSPPRCRAGANEFAWRSSSRSCCGPYLARIAPLLHHPHATGRYGLEKPGAARSH